jgi:predicted type IV restriction endonuclease
MAAPGPALEPEALTRKRRIDAALRESGWQIVPHLPGTPFASYHHAAVTEFPTANGPADYALIANNRILAIVEAKRIGLAKFPRKAQRRESFFIANPKCPKHRGCIQCGLLLRLHPMNVCAE